jgi:hypothetical protein
MIRFDWITISRTIAIAVALSGVRAYGQETITTTPAAPPGQAAVSVPAPAAVQSPAPVPQEKFGREMNGHFFMPSHLIDDPFSYTAFAMYFGMGSGSALGPELQLLPPAVIGEKWYGFTGLGLGMLMNVKILEYLSARALLNTTAYLGTGSGAALTVGTSARITGDVGVKGSLPVGDNWRFAATLDVSYGPVFSLLLANGLVDALNNCRVNPSQCSYNVGQGFQQINTVTWIGGLSGSWAPMPYLGFTGNFQFIAPTKTGDASIAENGLVFAGSGEFDFLPLVKWLPLGVNAAYQLTTGVGGNKVATANEAGFGFYYTGRPHLALGLEIDWKWSTLETQQASAATLAWVNFRYYWN